MAWFAFFFRVLGFGFRVLGVSRAWSLGLGLGFWALLGCRLRVWGLGLWVLGVVTV